MCFCYNTLCFPFEDQNMPPPSMPLQQKDDFELKATKNQQMQEELSAPSLAA